MNRSLFSWFGALLFAFGCTPGLTARGVDADVAATPPSSPSSPASDSSSEESADDEVDEAAEATPSARSSIAASGLTESEQADAANDPDDEHGELADDVEDDDDVTSTPSRRALAPHPLDGVSDAEVFRRLKEEPAKLGSMSLGLPNGGSLINPVAMPPDPRWTLVDPSHAFGTQETVDYLVRAFGVSAAAVADTPPYFIGHLSARTGGHLNPHRSHQSGRDVDIGYVYEGGGRWYQRATQDSLDLARTWALVRALVIETDPQFILIDHSIQSWLYDYAVQQGEDRVWLEDLFKGTRGLRPALIRHAKGHATHLHVRFWNPIAEQTARRSYSGLVRLQRISPPTHFVTHKAKKGETLIHLAKRYGTTVRAIKAANGLRSSKIMARKQYRIPQKGGVSGMGPRTVMPERRLPPPPLSAVSARDTGSR